MKLNQYLLRSFVITSIVLSRLASATANEVKVNPAKDNTIYAESNSLSNGAGMFLFTGTNGGTKARRSLIGFELDGLIPQGAVIVNATLDLNLSRTISNDQSVAIHRLLRDWGEGTSDAPGEEGTGTAAMAGDATWSKAIFPNQDWSIAGGDFVEDESASTIVSGVGPYSWTSNGLLNDIQFWLDNPSENFGWILIGPEDGAGTVKRFDSQQNALASNRPTLTIEFESLQLEGDFNKNGELDVEDIDSLTQAALSGAHEAEFDLTNDGFVDHIDRTRWIIELKKTFFGDSNLDGEFGTTDLILTFAAGEYEDGVPGNSTWATGDWNGDTEFSPNDLIKVFQDGGFQRGPRPAFSVPEPTSGLFIIVLSLAIPFRQTEKKQGR